jgi:hypothetical protein
MDVTKLVNGFLVVVFVFCLIAGIIFLDQTPYGGSTAAPIGLIILGGLGLLSFMHPRRRRVRR